MMNLMDIASDYGITQDEVYEMEDKYNERMSTLEKSNESFGGKKSRKSRKSRKNI
jgi:DNA repair ATPase RecN